MLWSVNSEVRFRKAAGDLKCLDQLILRFTSQFESISNSILLVQSFANRNFGTGNVSFVKWKVYRYVSVFSGLISSNIVNLFLRITMIYNFCEQFVLILQRSGATQFEISKNYRFFFILMKCAKFQNDRRQWTKNNLEIYAANDKIFHLYLDSVPTYLSKSLAQ